MVCCCVLRILTILLVEPPRNKGKLTNKGLCGKTFRAAYRVHVTANIYCEVHKLAKMHRTNISPVWTSR